MANRKFAVSGSCVRFVERGSNIRSGCSILVCIHHNLDGIGLQGQTCRQGIVENDLVSIVTCNIFRHGCGQLEIDSILDVMVSGILPAGSLVGGVIGILDLLHQRGQSGLGGDSEAVLALGIHDDQRVCFFFVSQVSHIGKQPVALINGITVTLQFGFICLDSTFLDSAVDFICYGTQGCTLIVAFQPRQVFEDIGFTCCCSQSLKNHFIGFVDGVGIVVAIIFMGCCVFGTATIGFQTGGQCQQLITVIGSYCITICNCNSGSKCSGAQAQNQSQCQENGNKFFHCLRPFCCELKILLFQIGGDPSCGACSPGKEKLILCPSFLACAFERMHIQGVSR